LCAESVRPFGTATIPGPVLSGWPAVGSRRSGQGASRRPSFAVGSLCRNGQSGPSGLLTRQWHRGSISSVVLESRLWTDHLPPIPWATQRVHCRDVDAADRCQYSALRRYEDLLGITEGGADGRGHLGYIMLRPYAPRRSHSQPFTSARSRPKFLSGGLRGDRDGLGGGAWQKGRLGTEWSDT